MRGRCAYAVLLFFGSAQPCLFSYIDWDSLALYLV